MRRLLVPVAALLACAACGGGAGKGILARADEGLARIDSGVVRVHVLVHALVPIDRTEELQASEVPLARLRLERWARNPRRIACPDELECARAEVDVPVALRALEPILPELPLDPRSVRSAELDVAVARGDGRPRLLELRGEFDPGLVPGTIRFEVKLDLPDD